MKTPAAQLEREIDEALAGGIQATQTTQARRTVDRPIKIATTSPATMTAGAINRELDKLEARDSILTRRMIDAGRGHERPSDYRHKTDPTSAEMNRISERRMRLQIEIGSRYGPGAPSRLPSGRFFGPRRKAGDE